MNDGTIAYSAVFELARTVIATILCGVNVFFADSAGFAVAVQIVGMAILVALSRSEEAFLQGPLSTVKWATELRRATLGSALATAVMCGLSLAMDVRPWAFAFCVAMAVVLPIVWSSCGGGRRPPSGAWWRRRRISPRESEGTMARVAVEVQVASEGWSGQELVVKGRK